jgi:hypothetical protein
MLASNKLEEPVDLTLFGLVKADEKDKSVLLFSISSSCEQWMPIPVALISSIRHIRNVPARIISIPLSGSCSPSQEGGRLDCSLHAALCPSKSESRSGTNAGLQQRPRPDAAASL